MCPKFVVDLFKIIPLYVPDVCDGVIVVEVLTDCVIPVPILNRSAVLPPIESIERNCAKASAGAFASTIGPKVPDEGEAQDNALYGLFAVT